MCHCGVDQVAELIKSDERWCVLMDAPEAVRLMWAYRRLRHPDKLLEHRLEQRALTQVGVGF